MKMFLSSNSFNMLTTHLNKNLIFLVVKVLKVEMSIVKSLIVNADEDDANASKNNNPNYCSSDEYSSTHKNDCKD